MKRQARKSALGQFSSLSSRKLHVESLEHRRMLATFAVEAGGSIQEAIDAAADSPGADIIQIAPGTYTENLEIKDEFGVTLVGTGKRVVIKGDSDEHVIKIRKTDDVTIENLTLTGGKDGINAKEGNLTLIDVDVIGNGDEGVQAEEMDLVSITGGDVKNNVEDGIKVEESDEVILDGVSVKNNGDDGIKIETTETVSLKNVTVKGNGGDGIDLEEIETITVTDVIASGNGDEGLEVDDSGSIVVDGGKFADNTDEGIDIDNTGWITIRNVAVSDNGGGGLQVEGDDEDFTVNSVIVENSSFTDNGGDGIQIVQADDGSVGDVTLTSVKTTDNLESGLEIDISGDLTSTDVKSMDNGEADLP